MQVPIRNTIFAVVTIAIICGVVGCVVPQAINALANTGSGTFEQIAKRRQLERVARDWCMTIRASQVIPVYPLDEDIMPGDVYIASTPSETAQSLWRKHGFLPIDHRFARLRTLGYGDYYRGGYHTVQGVLLPNIWQFPATPPSNTGGAANSAFEKTDWQSAPRAGFPSYGFSIKRGESFSGALPVQGVPVALGALGARSVTGTITITNAFTYGVDEITLRREWERWASQTSIKDQLRDYAPITNTDKPRCYLRIVTRVYLARTMNVSMTNQDNSAWKLSAGAPHDDIKSLGLTSVVKDANGNLTTKSDTELDDLLAKLPGQSLNTGDTNGTTLNLNDQPAAGATPAPNATPAPGTPAPAANQTPAEAQLAKQQKELDLKTKQLALQEQGAKLQKQKAIDDFNAAVFRRGLQRAVSKDRFGGFVVPGGTIQMASATQNTISMNETFDRPLVIGYHSLDVPIYYDGEIGTPVSTYLLLEGRHPFGGKKQTVISSGFHHTHNVDEAKQLILKNPAQFLKWRHLHHPELDNIPTEELVTAGKYDNVLAEFINSTQKH